MYILKIKKIETLGNYVGSYKMKTLDDVFNKIELIQSEAILKNIEISIKYKEDNQDEML